MAAGDKPALSISLKPRGGSKEDRRYILSGWENDGRISMLSPDRKVTQIAVQFDDGEIIRVKKGADGKFDHFVDVFLRDGTYGEQRETQRDTAPREQRGRQQREPEPFGGDGDDLFG